LVWACLGGMLMPATTTEIKVTVSTTGHALSTQEKEQVAEAAAAAAEAKAEEFGASVLSSEGVILSG